MPRKAKSKRDAVTYDNRTDLPAAKPQAVAAAPNQAYGERGAQEAAQRSMPLPNELAAQQSGYEQAVATAQQTDFQPVNIAAPTDRPGQPITAGLSQGPGPGPEVLRAPFSAPSDVFQLMFERSQNPDLLYLADLVRSRGH